MVENHWGLRHLGQRGPNLNPVHCKIFSKYLLSFMKAAYNLDGKYSIDIFRRLEDGQTEPKVTMCLRSWHINNRFTASKFRSHITKTSPDIVTSVFYWHQIQIMSVLNYSLIGEPLVKHLWQLHGIEVKAKEQSLNETEAHFIALQLSTKLKNIHIKA